jgi:hypothetical protein
MDAQQQVNLALLERLQEAGIELAQSAPPAAGALKPAHR